MAKAMAQECGIITASKVDSIDALNRTATLDHSIRALEIEFRADGPRDYSQWT